MPFSGIIPFFLILLLINKMMKMKIGRVLQTPTNDLVGIYIDKIKNDLRYSVSDKAIINLFKQFPKNKELEDILLKICVINDMYSTNILGTFRMAEHIKQLDIDNALDNAEPMVVHEIAIGHGIKTRKGDRDINFYSFATKYCNWHNKVEYPIYDSFVHKILVAYRKRDSFSEFNDADLKDFPRFKQIITDFKNRYSLTKHGFREIDNFLWMYGKEVFPNNYKITSKNLKP